jgi:hypothetical protein
MTAASWIHAPDTFNWGQKGRTRAPAFAPPVLLHFVIFVGASFPLASSPRGA